ncbi:hypothetical protein DSO57_1002557 [Entomophthora muscae]|uniref:Uncharacterized protein n=1 Tax=Entomophthora muscae TaxID=34485 RepID=A0ACC2T8H6_9FUNG|nr:hypothetical protein DSO57_1002557 [Entomophthora muscae]
MVQKDSGGKKKLKETGVKVATPYNVARKPRIGAGLPKDWEDQASKSKSEACSWGSDAVNSDADDPDWLYNVNEEDLIGL